MSEADFGALPSATGWSDEDFMRAALGIGRRGMGRTGDNPAVGALVVRDGRIIGQGWTQDGGRPHAEPMALAMAGEGARGAKLYVTLEPCSHFGRSPPCANAIVEAGVARVVSAIEDPDARVAGRGHAILRAAGVDVVSGILESAARRAHSGHILNIVEGRPTVTLKLAETRDGYAAGDAHDPRLAITGAAANNRTHMLRALHDAIMIGVGTARLDDPLMTVRAPGLDARPARVVLDARLDLPVRSRLIETVADAPVLLIAGPQAEAARVAALRAAGAEIVFCDTDARGRLDLRAALRLLAQKGLRRVFSEGGPRVGADLIAHDLVETTVLFTAPKPLGRPGTEALPAGGRARLEGGGAWRLAHDGAAGVDRMRIYEREF